MYNTPLTQEQSDFAAKCHDLVYAFLHKNKLSEDEYYDVIIFGYLQAVRAYHEKPELQQYAFSTIAFSRMRGAVGNYHSSKNRRIKTVSLNENGVFGSVPSPELVLLAKEALSERGNVMPDNLVYISDYLETYEPAAA